MPNLLLINPNPYPKEPLSKPPFVPLGSLSVAACTPKDWEIRIVDERLGLIDAGNMNFRPDLVGIGAMTVQAQRAASLAKDFQETGIPVVLGGMHFSALADYYKDLGLAHIAVGEAESIWPRVIAEFESADGLSVKEYKIFTNPKTEHPSLDGMVLPRHLVDQTRYLLPTIQAGRGCPFRCSFCSVPGMFGNICRVRPIDQVIEEIKSLPGNKLLFVDDNLLYRNWHEEFFDALASQRRKIRKVWACQARINDLEDEKLDLMVKAGCVGIYVGLESVSSKNKKDSGKNVNVGMYADRIAAAHKRGLSIIAAFVIGFENDGDNIVNETLEFVNSNKIDLVQYAILIPLPGTAIESRLIEEKRYRTPKPEDFSLWPFFSGNEVLFEPYGIRRQQLADRLRQLYEIYSWSGILRRASLWRRSQYLNIVGNTTFRREYLRWLARRNRNSKIINDILAANECAPSNSN